MTCQGTRVLDDIDVKKSMDPEQIEEPGARLRLSSFGPRHVKAVETLRLSSGLFDNDKRLGDYTKSRKWTPYCVPRSKH